MSLAIATDLPDATYSFIYRAIPADRSSDGPNTDIEKHRGIITDGTTRVTFASVPFCNWAVILILSL